MRHDLNLKRRYYERFQVEDVINFFSGQLLQAKSSDGAQVFLQSIKMPRRPLPAGFQEAMRKLQHPHLAPVLDTMLDEDQLILVHPPFSGDPLPLLVNKEHTMEPEKAVRITSKLLRTLNDLERLPLPLSATLDPKNILLNGDKPIVLFYYVKEVQGSSYDEKWRDLLFYLLTGQNPVGGLKRCESTLESRRVPAKIIKLALQCLDRSSTHQQMMQAFEQYVTSNERAAANKLSRTGKKGSRKRIYTSVSVAAAALVLVTAAVTQFDGLLGNSNATEESYKVFTPPEPTQVIEQQKGQIFDSVIFTNEKNTFTFPDTLKGASSLRGEFKLEKLNEFQGWLETMDRKMAYGIRIDQKGKITLFQQQGEQKFVMGDSGSKYRIKPGKKYTFEMYYIPDKPLRISLKDEAGVEKWMAVGTSPVNAELKLNFRGYNGATLFYPSLNPITDEKVIDAVWMNQQPWKLDIGQAILKVDDQSLNHLDVFQTAMIRMDLTDSNSFTMLPSALKGPFIVRLHATDGAQYRVVLDKNKVWLQKEENGLVTLTEQPFQWTRTGNKPISVSVSTEFKQLKVRLSQESITADLTYEHPAPITIHEMTLQPINGLELLEEKKNLPKLKEIDRD